jgi:general stress protein YciG
MVYPTTARLGFHLGRARSAEFVTLLWLKPLLPFARLPGMTSKAVRAYLSKIGKRGGQAGRGTPKKHDDPHFYRRIGRKGAKARWAKARAAGR